MFKIDWYGNYGRCTLDPGTKESVPCGVCNTEMLVMRNVLGPTVSAEAISGNKHRHDRFWCPHADEDWHGHIVHLKMKIYEAEMHCEYGFVKEKRAAAKEIRALISAHLPAR